MSAEGGAAPALATPKRFPPRGAGRVAIGFALLVAFAGRLLYLAVVAPMPVQSDASGFDAAARRLMKTGTFAFPVGRDLWADDVFREDAWEAFERMPANAWCMPGYSGFLAGVYRIVGSGPGRFVAVRWVQALLGTLTVALMFRLADWLLGRRAAWVTLALAAAYPPSVRLTQYLLTETVFTLLLVGQVTLMVWAARSRRVMAYVGLGVITVAATYVRPVAMLVPGLLVVLETWRWVRVPSSREPLGRPLARFALLGLVIAALVAPWWVRNQHLYGVFLPTTSAAALPAVQGELHVRGRPFRYETLAQFATPQNTGNDDHRYAQTIAAEARELMPPPAPSEWVGMQIVKARMLVAALTTPFNFFSYPAQAWSPGFVMQLALLVLALWGLWRHRRDAETVILLGGLAAYFATVHWAVSMLWTRYFYPVMPFLLALAAGGLVRPLRMAAPAPTPQVKGPVVPTTIGVAHPAPKDPSPWLRHGPLALVVLASAGLLYFLSAELPPPPAYTNDFVLHLSLARGLEENRSLDFWHFTDLGYPTLRLYQPFYHLALALLDGATGGVVGLPWLAQLLLVGLALAVPAAIYLGGRRWLMYEGLATGEASWAAAIAALLGALSCSFSGFGYDPLQGIYARFGVVTQTWSMVFFVPAFAWAVGYLTGRERSPWPGLALSLVVWGFSLIIGVMHALCVALRVAVEVVVRREPRAVVRALGYFVGLALVTAFLWWPIVADTPWVNYPHPFIASWVNEGYGRNVALRALWSGTLLDGASLEHLGRAPIMSLLLGVGFVAVPGLWRRQRPLAVFLVVGYPLWFSLFAGKEVWGRLLYVLPLLRSYQWGRMEAMLQFWATIMAALGLARLWPPLWARLPGPARGALLATTVAALVLLARLPVSTAMFDRSILAQARTGGGGRLVNDVAAELHGETTRTYVGGPTTWEQRLITGQIWPGIALVGRGVAAAGRMYQGMNFASALVYLWDGTSPWGATLLSIGHWLAPCDQIPLLPVATPAVQVSAGVCLAHARSAPPLAFFSSLATTPVRILTEDQIVAQQRVLLRAPESDVFLPFRPGDTPATDLPATFAPARPMPASGERFARTAPGEASSRLSIDAPANGAVVFPVPFHPRLRGTVDGKDVAPVAVLPGYAAVAVAAGHHDVSLTYRTDHVRDALFLFALVMLAVGALAARRGRPGGPI